MATAVNARTLIGLLEGWREVAGSPGAPSYHRLAERIRLLLLDGRIGVDTQLPAERGLAERLGVSRTTVTSAYRRLREAGYLSSQQGSGSLTRLPRQADMSPLQGLDSPGLINFTTAATSASSGLHQATQQALDRFPRYLGQTGYEPVGVPELRIAVSARYDALGLPTAPEEIMITLGAQHAIGLLAKAFLSPADRVLVETPGYPNAFATMRSVTSRLVGTSVTPQGWDGPHLREVLAKSSPRMAYLMPDFQNPTGATMPAELRERFLAAAARRGTLVIADETTADLAFDRSATRTPFAAHGPAVLVGSVGKTIWGGLRIGWIRAPRPMIDRLVQTRAPFDLGTPILDQLVVAVLLESYDAILDELSATLRAGHELLAGELARRFPSWRAPEVDGGLALWANLGRPASSALTLAARARGLELAAGPRFGLGGAFERFIRVPFTYPAPLMHRAMEILDDAWASLPETDRPAPPLRTAETTEAVPAAII